MTPTSAPSAQHSPAKAGVADRVASNLSHVLFANPPSSAAAPLVCLGRTALAPAAVTLYLQS
jgi:hypothetical protein